MAERTPWIGVDLDATLAEYHTFHTYELGPPIPAMVERVKRWLAVGHPQYGMIEVRIFTARVADGETWIEDMIQRWCEEHLGRRLAVTNVKDYGMVELWDDRAVQVEANTGRRMDGQPEPVGPA